MSASKPRSRAPRAKTQELRKRVVQAAMPLFAEKGYEGARMEDLAATLGMAKSSIFQHFGSKEKLFVQVYIAAVRMLHPYLDVADEVRQQGFFEILRYWLARTDTLVRENWIPYRIELLGNYTTDLIVRREIKHFRVTEDPFGMRDFVRYGLERKELRRELDFDLIVSYMSWLIEPFQDALLVEELDPGLFRHPGSSPEKKSERIDQFLDLIRRAIGTHPLTRRTRRDSSRR